MRNWPVGNGANGHVFFLHPPGKRFQHSLWSFSWDGPQAQVTSTTAISHLAITAGYQLLHHSFATLLIPPCHAPWVMFQNKDPNCDFLKTKLRHMKKSLWHKPMWPKTEYKIICQNGLFCKNWCLGKSVKRNVLHSINKCYFLGTKLEMVIYLYSIV